jgi:co-chaperonin GroES (HSP10)
VPSVAIQHTEDPREVIWNKVGDLAGVEVFNNDVMVAIYERPNKTKSGIILTDRTVGEDLYQGKVGLILKMGPKAFTDPDFEESEKCSVGDWIFFRPSDGWAATLNTMQSVIAKDNIVNLRIVRDASIRGRVRDPDLIY